MPLTQVFAIQAEEYLFSRIFTILLQQVNEAVEQEFLNCIKPRSVSSNKILHEECSNCINLSSFNL